MVVTPSQQFLVKMLDTLNEAQARWYVALRRGRGGVQAMRELTGLSRPAFADFNSGFLQTAVSR